MTFGHLHSAAHAFQLRGLCFSECPLRILFVVSSSLQSFKINQGLSNETKFSCTNTVAFFIEEIYFLKKAYDTGQVNHHTNKNKKKPLNRHHGGHVCQ